MLVASGITMAAWPIDASDLVLNTICASAPGALEYTNGPDGARGIASLTRAAVA